ncbi:hypothetical protein UFB30_16195 [Jeotgalibacillus sp. HH7-29]|uniref:Uncharacterized protein n=1 Tax=Jeotgalibacillus haloalkalitolerans TaxID=3104292 RepID=A0ABU5KST6_9BACL|nr:hypothetical protein [Jeotgalibacillus sp. HH7-29]
MIDSNWDLQPVGYSSTFFIIASPFEGIPSPFQLIVHSFPPPSGS